MAFNPDRPFIPQLLPKALQLAYHFVNTPVKIPSTTVRTFMYPEVTSPTSGSVRVPLYWASWYHDGRGAIRARNKQYLVYYLNPADDPRLSGGRPQRPEQVISLSKFPGRLEKDLASGKCVMVKSVGPSRINYPYFDDKNALGMRGFVEKLDELGIDSLDDYGKGRLRSKGLLNRRVRVVL